MEERWSNFEFDGDLLDTYDVSEIIQNSKVTLIRLVGDINELEISFNFVDSMCITDEGRRLNTYNVVKELQNYRESFYGNPIYIKSNSNYVEWIKKESLGFTVRVTHYVIVTRDDIISSFPPKIKVIKLNN